MKPALLYLCHRIPYPPNKGDKVRSFNLLKVLAEHYQVHLGAFIDEPSDQQYVETLREWCASIYTEVLSAKLRKLFVLPKLLGDSSLTVPYYQSASMQSYVDQVISEGSERAVIFSSAMGQFILGRDIAKNTVVDFVDVDSDKWQQYANKKSGVARWVYRREARTLQAWERQLAAATQASVFVTDNEVALFNRISPETQQKTHALHNGVDLDYFCANTDFPNPFASTEIPIVFTGAMDYWANADAVIWFANEVLPKLVNVNSAVRFYIVGSKPLTEVQALQSNPAITVTGFVDDVRPYLQHARLAVAPLRIARGVQNKVLEAMAMSKAVVCSPAAMEGIKGAEHFAQLVVEEPQAMATTILDLLQDGSDWWGRRGREMVENQYTWARNLQSVVEWLQ